MCVFRQPPTLENMAFLRAESAKLNQTLNGKYASLSILERTGIGNPASDVREASASLARDFTLLGAAIVLEGSGFLPAAGRTLITGIFLLTKKKYPHKIFSDAGDGATWLVPFLSAAGIQQSASEILAAAEATRKAIKPT